MELIDLYLSQLILPFTRSLGVLVMIPFGNTVIGNSQRFVFATGLAVLFHESSSVDNIDALQLSREFVIGLVTGLPVAFATALVTMAGELIETGRGQNIAQLYDPLIGVQGAALSSLLSHFCWVHLLLLGILEDLIAALGTSFIIYPSGAMVYPAGSAGYAIFIAAAETMGGLFVCMLSFLLIYLIVDLGAGFIGKLVPQASLNSEAFQIKTVVTFVLLVVLSRSDLQASIYEIAQPLNLLSVTGEIADG